MDRWLGMGVALCLLLLGCGKDPEDPPPPNFPGVSTQKGSSNLSISGTAFYEDKPFTASGFTGAQVNLPIRHAVVNLIANDGIILLSSSQTGEDGSFIFNNIDNSSRGGGVFLQIQAKNASNSTSPAEIRSNSNALLGVSGPTLDDSLSNNFPLQVIVALSNNMGGAFNILDNFLIGGAFIQKPGFCPLSQTTACTVPFLTAFWEPGSSSGSFFDSGIPAVSIGGGGPAKNDTDEYDDTIILHEYGHFIASSFSHDDSPGGSHFIGENTQDIRLSWSEGWATFFASATLGSPIAVDTRANGVFTFNIDTNTSAFTTDELSNSSILWDTNTETGFLPIWESFTAIPSADIATIEPFAVLFMNQNPANKNSFQAILTERKIELFPDPSEVTGAETTLIVNGSSQHHTLYTTNNSDPFDDKDIIPFSANAGTTYTVNTFNLTNGADTFITINPSGLTNDNASGFTYSMDCASLPCPENDSTTLSSSISFTPTTGGTFSVSVKRSPTAPPSTGRAGSYNIKVTSP